jgi:hypothetical protein
LYARAGAAVPFDVASFLARDNWAVRSLSPDTCDQPPDFLSPQEDDYSCGIVARISGKGFGHKGAGRSLAQRM